MLTCYDAVIILWSVVQHCNFWYFFLPRVVSAVTEESLENLCLTRSYGDDEFACMLKEKKKKAKLSKAAE